jgi:hypothetical protein
MVEGDVVIIPEMQNEAKNFLIYSLPNNQVRVDVFVQNETLWLTQMTRTNRFFERLFFKFTFAKIKNRLLKSPFYVTITEFSPLIWKSNIYEYV